MKTSRTVFLLIASVLLLQTTVESFGLFGRYNVPFLSPVCDKSCPGHYCDDDKAIIFGYCCGCARYYDRLPVQCSPLIQCPLNTYELCEQYEYMMYCCC